MTHARYTSLFLLAVFAPTVQAQAESFTGVNVTSIMDKLEYVYGLPITVENAPFSGLATDRFKAGFTFSFEWPTPETTPEQCHDLASQAIHAALDTYNASYGAEMFTVSEGNGGFHVFPLRDANNNGKVFEFKHVLGEPITVTLDEQTPTEAIGEIIKAATAANRYIDLTPGDVRAAWDAQGTKIKLAAAGEPAQDVIDKLLSQLHIIDDKRIKNTSRTEGGSEPGFAYVDVPAHLSWSVLCGGGRDAGPSCLFHFHYVHPPDSAPYIDAMQRRLNAATHTQSQ